MDVGTSLFCYLWQGGLRVDFSFASDSNDSEVDLRAGFADCSAELALFSPHISIKSKSN